MLFFLFLLYAIFATALFLYGLNCYYAIWLFLKNRRWQNVWNKRIRRNWSKKDLPVVTTQLPIYNEANVVEKLLKTVCALDYPKDKHQIQVLDDSTDGSSAISKKWVEILAAEGYWIEWIFRSDRIDYKAGALKEALESAKGEYIAMFDADFQPEKDFLYQTLPFFAADPKVGLVQGRWGHLNRHDSLLTSAQAVGIDGHFVIEQSARSWGGLYMNFNGSAGIWRKQAIYDSGNWEGDTLTEDMDLSYRAQLAGWKMKFCFDVIVPAEIPADINAFKSQQYRWAKGSIQTAIKILPRIFKSKISFNIKLQSFMHMTHYCIHPLILGTAILSFPILMWVPYKLSDWLFYILALLVVVSALAPSVLYVIAQRYGHPLGWKSRLRIFPFLMSIGTGIALNNTRAVVSALLGRKSPFVRTPKVGEVNTKAYHLPFPVIAFGELMLAIYCGISLWKYVQVQKYLVGPFLALYAMGFLAVAIMSFRHYYKQNRNL